MNNNIRRIFGRFNNEICFQSAWKIQLWGKINLYRP